MATGRRRLRRPDSDDPPGQPPNATASRIGTATASSPMQRPAMPVRMAQRRARRLQRSQRFRPPRCSRAVRRREQQLRTQIDQLRGAGPILQRRIGSAPLPEAGVLRVSPFGVCKRRPGSPQPSTCTGQGRTGGTGIVDEGCGATACAPSSAHASSAIVNGGCPIQLASRVSGTSTAISRTAASTQCTASNGGRGDLRRVDNDSTDASDENLTGPSTMAPRPSLA